MTDYMPGLTRRTLLAASTAVGVAALASSSAIAGGSDDIRPFHVKFSEDELAELRRRIKATKWPERETVTDASQGRAARDDPEARALLGDGVRLAQGARRG